MFVFDNRAIATIRGALLFWSEEIAPYGAEAARHYLDSQDPDPSSMAELAELRRWLQSVTIRYARLNTRHGTLPSLELLETLEQLPQDGSPEVRFATILEGGDQAGS